MNIIFFLEGCKASKDDSFSLSNLEMIQPPIRTCSAPNIAQESFLEKLPEQMGLNLIPLISDGGISKMHYNKKRGNKSAIHTANTNTCPVQIKYYYDRERGYALFDRPKSIPLTSSMSDDKIRRSYSLPNIKIEFRLDEFDDILTPQSKTPFILEKEPESFHSYYQVTFKLDMTIKDCKLFQDNSACGFFWNYSIIDYIKTLKDKYTPDYYIEFSSSVPLEESLMCGLCYKRFQAYLKIEQQIKKHKKSFPELMGGEICIYPHKTILDDKFLMIQTKSNKKYLISKDKSSLDERFWIKAMGINLFFLNTPNRRENRFEFKVENSKNTILGNFTENFILDLVVNPILVPDEF